MHAMRNRRPSFARTGLRAAAQDGLRAVPRRAGRALARLGIATLALAAAVSLPGCGSDPTADPNFRCEAEVFWMRFDDRVGVIDHSIVSYSLPEERYRELHPEAAATGKAARKFLDDASMYQVIANLEDMGFDELAAGSILPGAWDVVGLRQGGTTRYLSIYNSKATQMSADDQERARNMWYFVWRIDNSIHGFEARPDMRPEDFARQRETIRQNYEEALRRDRSGG